MQSGQGSHFPEFSKLHKFDYSIEPHHQKYVNVIKHNIKIYEHQLHSKIYIYIYIYIYENDKYMNVYIDVLYA